MKTVKKIKVGDVLVRTWGYDARLANFYKVIARTPASVKVRELDQIRAGDWHDGTSTPTDTFKANAEEFRPRVKVMTSFRNENVMNEYVTIKDNLCDIWDGNPVKTYNHH